MRLLLFSAMMDSHYFHFSEAKRRAWRHMLQNSQAKLAMLRSYYYMDQFDMNKWS